MFKALVRNEALDATGVCGRIPVQFRLGKRLRIRLRLLGVAFDSKSETAAPNFFGMKLRRFPKDWLSYGGREDHGDGHHMCHSETRRRTEVNRESLSLAVGLGVARAPQACTTKEADTVPMTAHSTKGRPATRPARKPPQ